MPIDASGEFPHVIREGVVETSVKVSGESGLFRSVGADDSEENLAGEADEVVVRTSNDVFLCVLAYYGVDLVFPGFPLFLKYFAFRSLVE